jgi:hypothetical protein
MKSTKKRGMIVQADDLEVGGFYAVYGLKNGWNEPVPVSGLAFRRAAMNLPFLGGKLASDPSHPPITFDARYLKFMRVSPEFVHAQRPDEKDAP